MNTVPAIGSPGSMMRLFQERPELGVQLFQAAEIAADAIENHGRLVGPQGLALDALNGAIQGVKSKDQAAGTEIVMMSPAQQLNAWALERAIHHLDALYDATKKRETSTELARVVTALRALRDLFKGLAP